jgi:hypothetical protein
MKLKKLTETEIDELLKDDVITKEEIESSNKMLDDEIQNKIEDKENEEISKKDLAKIIQDHYYEKNPTHENT